MRSDASPPREQIGAGPSGSVETATAQCLMLLLEYAPGLITNATDRISNDHAIRMHPRDDFCRFSLIRRLHRFNAAEFATLVSLSRLGSRAVTVPKIVPKA
ncbi:hypothetical protein CTI14_02660 [Methylobacterium radiotolerans]|nr:hypothetical protein CTI14_02660 [Methylobacterium radiotolerans]